MIGVWFFGVKERENVELLPAQRNTRIVTRRGSLSARTLDTHDAVIIACSDQSAENVVSQLPSPAVWGRLYRDAKRSGPVRLLSTRLGGLAIPVVVLFTPMQGTAFERLSAAGRAWKELKLPMKANVLLASQGLELQTSAAIMEALLAAGLAATAPMPNFKSRTAPKAQLTSVTLMSEGATLDVDRTVAIDRGNHVARWLTTLPPNVLDTIAYRRVLQKLAREQGYEFKFYDEAALKRAGAGAFLAVTRANEHRGAGIVRLRYRTAAKKNSGKLALVGKGICFDTGGINLKTHKGMYQMHEDMQGSAVAVGSLVTLSQLKAPFDIDCWLAITENQIGARAYRPQEVVRAANGVTIQVAHSDAEGRMVLADTLALAARETPDAILDYATLTGACINALTERFSGAFTNRPDLHATLERTGRESGERVWPFPMDEDFDSDLDSSIADVLQCTPDSKGDHILAARFLNRFVPQEIPWIHFDLAASNRSGGLAHIPTEFTGFGVRYTAHLMKDATLLNQK
jgi:leucyl aminopeptidase